MQRSIRILAAMLACAPLLAVAVTADELVEKNLAARGGIDKLRALHSIRQTGRLRTGGVELRTVFLAQHPAEVRYVSSLQGFDTIYAYDGKDAWKIDPTGGRKDPERLSRDESKGLLEATDFEGWLVDYKKKGYRVEYLGTEDVDGTDAHKLKLTRPNGDFHYLFLDPDHFLEIRIETHEWIRGSEQVGISDYGEYAQVNGLWWPGLVVSYAKGSASFKQTTVIDKTELDVPLDDALFHFPDAAKH